MTPSTDQQEKVDVTKVDRAVKLLTEILDDFDREMADDIEAEDFNIGQDEQIELPTESFRTLLTAFAAEREENERLRMEIMGGEDVPGLAASLPLQTILDIQADNVAVSRSSFERLLTAQAQITAQAEEIRAFGDLQNEHANLLEASRRQDETITAQAETIKSLARTGSALLDSIDMADPLQWGCSTVAYSDFQTALSKALPDTGEQSQ